MALGAWLDVGVKEVPKAWPVCDRVAGDTEDAEQSATFEILLGCRRDAQNPVCLVSRVTNEMKKKSPR